MRVVNVPMGLKPELLEKLLTAAGCSILSCSHEIGPGGQLRSKAMVVTFARKDGDREESSGERSNPIPSDFTVTLGKRAPACMRFDRIQVLCMPRMPEHMPLPSPPLLPAAHASRATIPGQWARWAPSREAREASDSLQLTLDNSKARNREELVETEAAELQPPTQVEPGRAEPLLESSPSAGLPVTQRGTNEESTPGAAADGLRADAPTIADAGRA